MKFLRGWGGHEVKLNTARVLLPEEVMEKLTEKAGPYWINVEGKRIRVFPGSCMQLAAEIFTAYHGAYATESDGFQEHTARYERLLQEQLDAASSSSDNDTVTSAEDLVFEDQAYR